MGKVNIMKKTQGIEEFVSEVIETISTPYGEDVILDVFLAIERQPTWQRRYTKQITGLKNPSQISTKLSKLTGSYSKLYL
jgi:hypothetical protein